MSYRSEPNENLFVAAQYLLVLIFIVGKAETYRRVFLSKGVEHGRQVKSKIKEASSALGSAAKIAGENAKTVAGKVSDKAAETTKSVGTAVKKTGESIQKKSGK